MFTKLIFRTLLLLGCVLTLNAQAETIGLKKGSVLTYEVRSGSTTYDFIVTITSLEEGIQFDYKMTAPANVEGSVSITEEALESAFAMVNYFRGGAMTLEDATTVFLCRECFEASKGGDIELYLDGAEEATVLDAVVPGYSPDVTINGEVHSIKGRSIHNQTWSEEQEDLVMGEQIIVMEDPKYPLILVMYLGFSIELKSADNVDLIP